MAFRGNEHTLKVVDVGVCTNLIQTILNFLLLTICMYAKLQLVTIRAPTGLTETVCGCLCKVIRNKVYKAFQGTQSIQLVDQIEQLGALVSYIQRCNPLVHLSRMVSAIKVKMVYRH